MGQRDQLLRLVEQLYAAPGTSEGWQPFLEQLCDALNGSAANFISHNLAAANGCVTLTARTDPAALTAYQQHWIRHDPWARQFEKRARASGVVIVGEQLVTDAELRRTPFYNEFSRQYEIGRCVAGLIEMSPRAYSVISVNGAPRRKPFGDAEASLLRRLMPHVHRALQIHRRLTAADARASALTQLFERTVHAVLLIDRAGDVIQMNPAAEQLLRARDGLLLDRKQLRATSAADTDALRTCLFAAIRTSTDAGLSAGGTLLLRRSSGKRPLLAVVSPLSMRPEWASDAQIPVAVMIVTDPLHGPVPDAAVLRGFLGLTASEASLVLLLAQGLTLAEAAARLGVRETTLRTRLKTIFHKTNTHRQSELVRLALAVTPPVR
jgi:DNA-binding CsgD family transcriptional regulator/PAS domain-containing protein